MYKSRSLCGVYFKLNFCIFCHNLKPLLLKCTVQVITKKKYYNRIKTSSNRRLFLLNLQDILQIHLFFLSRYTVKIIIKILRDLYEVSLEIFILF